MFQKFKSGLGNVPIECSLDGWKGIQRYFCVKADFDVKKYCEQTGITEYSEVLFLSDDYKFNNMHKIVPVYTRDAPQPYLLVHIDDESY